MTDITIPPEALTAARLASMNALGDGEDAIEAACLAMLKAWPGMEIEMVFVEEDYLILPLPTKNSNE